MEQWTAAKVTLNQQLRALWTQHIYWTRLTVNSIAGRLPDEAPTTARLLRNADDIARFLGQINPYFSEAAWRNMMHEHLRLLSEEIAYRLAGDYERNVATNDQVEAQALEMADRMTSGIARQFPAMFTH